MQHGTRHRRVDQSSTAVLRRKLVLFLVLSIVSGCVTPWEKSALMKDSTPNISNVQGPTERRLNWLKFDRKVKEVATDETGSLKPLAGTEEFLQATELYNDEKYAEAQAAFRKVAKKYKKYEIREDALFMEGESAFQQDHYSKAHDFYAVLLKEYPSTRHLDVVSERLFKIGRIWLDFPEVAKLDEIKQVNFENPKHRLPADEPPKPNKTPVFVPNFRDKQRPLFDTPGNGVSALQAIWMNDPTGPLADDAMMLVASHHARRGNYVEADRYFRMLRETFPNSPHLQSAFLLGSHVKLMSYQGPDYDGKSLGDAQQLKESTLRLFPNIDDADRLRFELEKIQEAKAEREWKTVEYELRRKNKRAASVNCHQLIAHFPKSRYADMAREQLEKFGPEYVSGAVLLTPYDPKKPTLLERIMPRSQPPKPTQVALPTETPMPDDNTSKPNTQKPPSNWLPKSFQKRPEANPPAELPESDNPPEESTHQAVSGTKPEVKKQTPKRRSFFAPKQLPPDDDSPLKRLPDNSEPGRTKL